MTVKKAYSQSSSAQQNAKLKAARQELKVANATMAPLKHAAKEIKRISNQTTESPFESPQAHNTTLAFNQMTGEEDPAWRVASKVFAITLAKTALAGAGPLSARELDLDEVREKLFDLVGRLGWERLLFMVAQAARLWAEMPGPKAFNDDEKELMHKMSSELTKMLRTARAVDRASKQ